MERAVQFREAGFGVPKKNTSISAREFWILTNEGWHFVMDEDGETVVAFFPPTLTNRLNALRKRG